MQRYVGNIRNFDTFTNFNDSAFCLLRTSGLHTANLVSSTLRARHLTHTHRFARLPGWLSRFLRIRYVNREYFANQRNATLRKIAVYVKKCLEMSEKCIKYTGVISP